MKNPRQHRHQLVAITQRNGNYCYYYYLIVYVNTYKHFSRGKFKRKRKVRYDNVNHHEKGNKKKTLVCLRVLRSFLCCCCCSCERLQKK